MEEEQVVLLDNVLIRIEAISFKRNSEKNENYLRVKTAMLDANENIRGYLFYTVEKINPENSIAHHLATKIAWNYMDISLDEFIHRALGKKLYANLIGVVYKGKKYISTLCFPEPEWIKEIPAWDFSFEAEQDEESDCEYGEQTLMMVSGWDI